MYVDLHKTIQIAVFTLIVQTFLTLYKNIHFTTVELALRLEPHTSSVALVLR